MVSLIEYLSWFLAGSFVVGGILNRWPITAMVVCPLLSYTFFLLARDWSDFDASAIWSTPGSTASWVFSLALYFVLHGFPSIVGAAVGSFTMKALIDRLSKRDQSS
jgi:hypothetical protein